MTGRLPGYIGAAAEGAAAASLAARARPLSRVLEITYTTTASADAARVLAWILANDEAAADELLEFAQLTERELLKVLEKHGVKKFEPLGEKFDPNLHQAVFEMPDPSKPAGTVAQVIQPGYMIGERVLRPAMVAVAKGGPKPTAAGPANDNPDAAC